LVQFLLFQFRRKLETFLEISTRVEFDIYNTPILFFFYLGEVGATY
jgi:hypothetical protein